ncbi:MAG: hypothetical protein M3R09_10695 [Actinomycetota bacterium]|nr:hypothetical protein [Euzebyales bacterium]MDQ3030469.1 hypothetical protein [Actinomycetota bacterium]
MAYTTPPDEFREKMRSINIGASAMPTRKVETRTIQAREDRWAKDIPAYRRLAKEGLQPRGVDGCAEIEKRAVERHEVEGTPA